MRGGSIVTLDRTEAAMSDEDEDQNLDFDEEDDEATSTAGTAKRSDSSQNLGEFMSRYKKIQTWHVRSVIAYWVVTIFMLIVCFILFVTVVTPDIFDIPNEYEFLKG